MTVNSATNPARIQPTTGHAASSVMRMAATNSAMMTNMRFALLLETPAPSRAHRDRARGTRECTTVVQTVAG